MWRVAKSTFKPIQHAPAIEVRQVEIERDGVGLEFARQRKRRGSALGDDAFEAFFVRHLQQNAAVIRIVFDDQQHFVARIDFAAIIVDRGFRGRHLRCRFGSTASVPSIGSSASGCDGALTARLVAHGAHRHVRLRQDTA